MPVEGLFLPPASISSDNRGRNRQKWNSNNKDEDYERKKPFRHRYDRGDLVEAS